MARVVVLDDSESVRQVMREMLEEDGHQVELFADCAQVLSYIRASREPRIVLLDRYVPPIDAIQMLQEIAAEPDLARRHRYVLVTGSSHPWSDEVQEMLTRLEVPVLEKPFDMDALLTLVAECAVRLEE